MSRGREHRPPGVDVRIGRPGRADWSTELRFCLGCGAARDEHSMVCGYRDADDDVLYWWCSECGVEALIVVGPDVITVTDVIESDEDL